MDAEGKITRLNKTAEKLFGITTSQACEKPVPLFFQDLELDEVFLYERVDESNTLSCFVVGKPRSE